MEKYISADDIRYQLANLKQLTFEVTDACNAFPSGDPFLVYPGEDGHPEESIVLTENFTMIMTAAKIKP